MHVMHPRTSRLSFRPFRFNPANTLCFSFRPLPPSLPFQATSSLCFLTSRPYHLTTSPLQPHWTRQVCSLLPCSTHGFAGAFGATFVLNILYVVAGYDLHRRGNTQFGPFRTTYSQAACHSGHLRSSCSTIGIFDLHPIHIRLLSQKSARVTILPGDHAGRKE